MEFVICSPRLASWPSHITSHDTFIHVAALLSIAISPTPRARIRIVSYMSTGAVQEYVVGEEEERPRQYGCHGRRGIGIELKDSYYNQMVKNLSRAEECKEDNAMLFREAANV